MRTLFAIILAFRLCSVDVPMLWMHGYITDVEYNECQPEDGDEPEDPEGCEGEELIEV